MKIVNLFVASLFLIAGGCSSMGNGPFALEARGVVYDNYMVKDPVPGSDFRDDKINAKGVGLQAAINSPVVDFIFGYERRQLGGQDADELAAGIRKRFFDLVKLEPYMDFRVLYGRLDTGDGKMTYAGASVGAGLLFAITDHFYVDGNVSYEVTNKVDVGIDSTPFMGLLGRIGIGWAF